MIITTSFLQQVLGREPLKSEKQISLRFENVLSLYKQTFPHLDMGDSATMALSAMQFTLNAKVYFKEIAGDKYSAFFETHKNEFFNHFDYQTSLKRIKLNDRVLFLYSVYSSAKRKLSANGVIGKLQSIEQYYHWDNPYNDSEKVPQSNSIVIKLQISNNGIVDLLVEDMAYFGKWDKQLELII